MRKQESLFTVLDFMITKQNIKHGNQQGTYHKISSYHIYGIRNSRFQIVSTRLTTAEQYIFHIKLLHTRLGQSSTVEQFK